MIHLFTTTVIPALLAATFIVFLTWHARKKDLAALCQQTSSRSFRSASIKFAGGAGRNILFHARRRVMNAKIILPTLK